MPEVIICNNSRITEVYLSILKNLGQFFHVIIDFKDEWWDVVCVNTFSVGLGSVYLSQLIDSKGLKLCNFGECMTLNDYLNG